jgi:hypothetical protein
MTEIDWERIENDPILNRIVTWYFRADEEDKAAFIHFVNELRQAKAEAK